jgi:hypothetical protein
MTPQRGRTAAGSKHTPPENTPRLRLKPKAPPTGYVDGAWWPHGDDLPIELPDLLAVLRVRLGPIDRVIYNLTEWAKAPPKLPLGGRVAGQHHRSNRSQPRQDRPAGSARSHRPRPRT